MNTLNYISTGLMGFALFFSIILLIKLFYFILGFSHSLNIELIDIYHSLFGLLFVFNSFARRIIKKS